MVLFQRFTADDIVRSVHTRREDHIFYHRHAIDVLRKTPDGEAKIRLLFAALATLSEKHLGTARTGIVISHSDSDRYGPKELAAAIPELVSQFTDTHLWFNDLAHNEYAHARTPFLYFRPKTPPRYAPISNHGSPNLGALLGPRIFDPKVIDASGLVVIMARGSAFERVNELRKGVEESRLEPECKTRALDVLSSTLTIIPFQIGLADAERIETSARDRFNEAERRTQRNLDAAQERVQRRVELERAAYLASVESSPFRSRFEREQDDMHRGWEEQAAERRRLVRDQERFDNSIWGIAQAGWDFFTPENRGDRLHRR